MNHLLPQKILEFIKSNGYTKHSFAKIIGSTKRDIDKLIKGNLDQEKVKEIIQKIEQKFNITCEQLLKYQPRGEGSNKNIYTISETYVHYKKLEPKVQQQFNILDNILHLCEIYFTKKDT